MAILLSLAFLLVGVATLYLTYRQRQKMIKNISTAGFSPGFVTTSDGHGHIEDHIEVDIEIVLNEQFARNFVVFADWKPLHIIDTKSRDSLSYEVTVEVPSRNLPINRLQVDVRRWWSLYRLTAKQVLPHPILRQPPPK